MKKYIILIALSAAFAFPACEMLNDPNSALSTLGTQAIRIGIQQVTGKQVSSADLDGAAALIRSLAGNKEAPAPTDIHVAVATGTANPSKAQTLASRMAGFISDAIFKGAKPDSALETAAINLNKAAQATKAP